MPVKILKNTKWLRPSKTAIKSEFKNSNVRSGKVRSFKKFGKGYLRYNSTFTSKRDLNKAVNRYLDVMNKKLGQTGLYRVVKRTGKNGRPVYLLYNA
jgi:hypothetical protein